MINVYTTVKLPFIYCVGKQNRLKTFVVHRIKKTQSQNNSFKQTLQSYLNEKMFIDFLRKLCGNESI